MTEYFKKWKEEHKDYWKKYYIKNKDKILETARRWCIDNAGDYIYFLLDVDKNVLYIGSTQQALSKRISAHMTADSNLKMNVEELIDKYNFATIIFKDLTKYNLNKAELNFIENYYKDKYKEIIANRKARYSDCNLTKNKDELINIAENEQFKEFEKLDKYLN